MYINHSHTLVIQISAASLLTLISSQPSNRSAAFTGHVSPEGGIDPTLPVRVRGMKEQRMRHLLPTGCHITAPHKIRCRRKELESSLHLVDERKIWAACLCDGDLGIDHRGYHSIWNHSPGPVLGARSFPLSQLSW